MTVDRDPVTFGNAEHFAHLTARNLDPDTGQKSDQHGTRQEVGEESEPKQTRQQQERARDQCDEAGERNVLR